MNNPPNLSQFDFELSIEQELRLRIIKTNAEGLSHEETKDLLLDVMFQLMVKDNLLRGLLKK